MKMLRGFAAAAVAMASATGVQSAVVTVNLTGNVFNSSIAGTGSTFNASVSYDTETSLDHIDYGAPYYNNGYYLADAVHTLTLSFSSGAVSTQGTSDGISGSGTIRVGDDLDGGVSGSDVVTFGIAQPSGPVFTNGFTSAVIGLGAVSPDLYTSVALPTSLSYSDYARANNAVQFYANGKFVFGYITSFTVDAVPEPASWALMLGGFGMVGATLRARRKVVVSFG